MNILTTIPPFDEFNSMSCVNWEGKKNEFRRIVCFKNHDIMFPCFDEIITIDKEFSTNHTNEQRIKEVDMLKNYAKKLSDDIHVYKDVAKNNNFKHGYNYVFSKLSQEIQEGKGSFFNPKESDYLEIKEKLKGLNKKIVTINGRNVSGAKVMGRNNCLEGLINDLLKEGVVVINCTTPSCNLKIEHENYMDVSEDCLSYSKNISYFLNSDALVSIANAGGITNHVSTGSNIILYGPGGWVDNAKFGFNNISLYDAKAKISKNAFKADSSKKVLEIIGKLNKPEVSKFFDERKIKPYPPTS